MTTLIAVYNSSGCVGRCDAKCYEAQEPKCDCICHGRNHGAGKAQAVDNTRELADAWMEAYSREHNLTGETWEVPALQPVQLDLF
ncbi:MAG TPA: hypothetical protein PKC99_18465 [Anaerolineales bacterium]|nr:hypothetical protein [Anaerolineae bacterium]MBW7918649.1 hypothetical protein [Anaerolineales bacterium]MCG3145289.1 hypothetical protein [Gammaproteobacteria bacterium]MDL1926939.1 hypothetical protein [Anaerolineae bacterium AMX1]GIK10737.1 MAG: hypothetical protein BroJett001_28030 [Chloroflexota bacterium]